MLLQPTSVVVWRGNGVDRGCCSQASDAFGRPFIEGLSRATYPQAQEDPCGYHPQMCS